MKKILLPLLLFTSVFAYSQVFNNEWINYNSTYYKFKANLLLHPWELETLPRNNFNCGETGNRFPFTQRFKRGLWVAVIILNSGER
jgi:hypothetical protein